MHPNDPAYFKRPSKINYGRLRGDLSWPSKYNLWKLIFLFPVSFSSSCVFNGLLMNKSDTCEPVFRHIPSIITNSLPYLVSLFHIYVFLLCFILFWLSILNNCASEKSICSNCFTLMMAPDFALFPLCPPPCSYTVLAWKLHQLSRSKS